MVSDLPKRLNKEPLIDAVFEMRFSVSDSVSGVTSSILPGILFEKLDGKKTIEQLSVSGLPKQLRDTDPNLRFTPVVRILWENFLILIGDRVLAVASKIPYVGWLTFREAILQVVGIVGDIGIIELVYRYSLKYVDLMQYKNIEEQVASVNLTLQVGDHSLDKEVFRIRIEIPRDEYINAIQIISSAEATTMGETTKKEGLIIDIDTINILNNHKFTDFSHRLSEKLDKIHLVNKEAFFKCITPATLERLEPIYE